MKVFNTLTRQKEELKTIEPGKVRIYACGPTVYNFIHIGNARPICVFDVLRRYLEYRGYEVNFVQNFTDIDDKMIRRANEEGVAVADIAEKYIAEYQKDAAGLNVRPATIHPKATENIDAILHIIGQLVEKGYAYPQNGDVYFRAKKFAEYGKLSHQPLEDLEAGARIDVSEHKENPMDFALWKGVKPGEPFWPSPWGDGRPGWHIECSAMAGKYLGDTIDIHCGGQDLIFPHHENEIAQSECAHGAPFANYWMHNGYINVDNRKMSKSLGNFFTVRDVADKFGYEPIRFMMLNAHYRSPINYSVEIIEQCKSALERLYTCRDNLDFALQNAEETSVSNLEELLRTIRDRKDQFIAAMDDDLNTADAIAVLFDFARDINTQISANQVKSRQYLTEAAKAFDELCGVLGLLYNRKADDGISEEIKSLVEQRTAARKAKDFQTADAIRDKLKELGVEVKDTPQGPQILFLD